MRTTNQNEADSLGDFKAGNVWFLPDRGCVATFIKNTTADVISAADTHNPRQNDAPAKIMRVTVPTVAVEPFLSARQARDNEIGNKALADYQQADWRVWTETWAERRNHPAVTPVGNFARVDETTFIRQIVSVADTRPKELQYSSPTVYRPVKAWLVDNPSDELKTQLQMKK